MKFGKFLSLALVLLLALQMLTVTAFAAADVTKDALAPFANVSKSGDNGFIIGGQVGSDWPEVQLRYHSIAPAGGIITTPWGDKEGDFVLEFGGGERLNGGFGQLFTIKTTDIGGDYVGTLDALIGGEWVVLGSVTITIEGSAAPAAPATPAVTKDALAPFANVYESGENGFIIGGIKDANWPEVQLRYHSIAPAGGVITTPWGDKEGDFVLEFGGGERLNGGFGQLLTIKTTDVAGDYVGSLDALIDGEWVVLSSITVTVKAQAPETQAPATEAPETQAPETQAPATEVPATQAPETQAPATETPAVSAPQTSNIGIAAALMFAMATAAVVAVKKK